MIKTAVAATTLAATAVLAFATSAPARADVPTTTPAWIGPTPTGGPAGVELKPVSTPSGSLRASTSLADENSDNPVSTLSYQRYSSAGWGPVVKVDTATEDPEGDLAAVTADDTTARFVEPYLDSSFDERLRFITTNGTAGGTTKTELGVYDTPSLGTDTSGNSMVVVDGGADDDSLIALHVSSAGTVASPVVLQASGVYGGQVVATGADTYLAVWSSISGSKTAVSYATYAGGTWSEAALVPGITDGFATDVISTSTRQVLGIYDFTTANADAAYFTFTGTTWAATSTNTSGGDLTAAPDGTVYAGGATLGTLPVGSSTWTTGVAAPGEPTGQSCDDQIPSAVNLVWDNAISAPRTFQDSESASGCESLTWVLGQRTVGTDLYTPLAPKRILDTRVGQGAPKAAVGTGKSLTLSFAGKVPANATAVALNITGTGGTADTYVTGYPTGTTKPTASSLNLAKGQTAASLGLFKLGTNQSVTLFNYSGNLQLVGDLAGYESPSGLPYSPITPTRVLDTRLGTGAARAPVGMGKTITLNLTGIVPDDATAVALNVTGTDTTTSTYLAAYPAGTTRPSASTVNIAKGETSTNLSLVKLGANHSVTLFNYGGSTQVVGDLAGYYAGTGKGFVSLAPVRVLDTRTGLGAPKGARSPGSTFDLALASTVPVDATAVAIRITGVTPNHPSYVSAFPAGATRPSASTVNTTPGRATGNLAIVKLGTGQAISLYEGIGTEHLVGDVVGYFR